MKKLKALPANFLPDSFCAHVAIEEARSRGHVEYGVTFAISKAYGGNAYGNAVLFREDHHTREDVQIAAARVTALHFFDGLLVVDVEEAGALAA